MDKPVWFDESCTDSRAPGSLEEVISLCTVTGTILAVCSEMEWHVQVKKWKYQMEKQHFLIIDDQTNYECYRSTYKYYNQMTQ
jgi:hypothetical protein